MSVINFNCVLIEKNEKLFSISCIGLRKYEIKNINDNISIYLNFNMSRFIRFYPKISENTNSRVLNKTHSNSNSSHLDFESLYPNSIRLCSDFCSLASSTSLQDLFLDEINNFIFEERRNNRSKMEYISSFF